MPFDEIISLVIIVAQLITDVTSLMINLFVFNRAIAVQIWASGAKSPGKISSKSITNALASNEEFSGLRGTRLGPWAGLEIWCLGRQASPFSKLDLGTHLYETEFGISSKTTSNKDAAKKTGLNSVSGASSVM